MVFINYIVLHDMYGVVYPYFIFSYLSLRSPYVQKKKIEYIIKLCIFQNLHNYNINFLKEIIKNLHYITLNLITQIKGEKIVYLFLKYYGCTYIY